MKGCFGFFNILLPNFFACFIDEDICFSIFQIGTECAICDDSCKVISIGMLVSTSCSTFTVLTCFVWLSYMVVVCYKRTWYYVSHEFKEYNQ